MFTLVKPMKKDELNQLYFDEIENIVKFSLVKYTYLLIDEIIYRNTGMYWDRNGLSEITYYTYK